MISLSGLSVGDKIAVPGPAVSDAIKKLWRQRIFGDVSVSANKIEGNKISLVINLAEKPRLSRIEISGINKTQRGEINDDLTLIKGQIVDETLINRARLAAKDFFVDKGFLNVAIDVQQQPDTVLNNSIVLKLIIDKKGDKVAIKRINFEGNEVFSDKRLKGQTQGNPREGALHAGGRPDQPTVSPETPQGEELRNRPGGRKLRRTEVCTSTGT